MQILAKSNGISLLDHSKVVTVVGNYLARKLFVGNTELIEKTTIACALHDLGKCYSNFQVYIKKGNFSEELEGSNFAETKKDQSTEILLHNTISWSWLVNNIRLNYRRQDDVLGAILYHHPLTDYNAGKKSQEVIEMLDETTEENLSVMFESLNEFLIDTYNINTIFMQENENYNHQPSYYTVTSKKTYDTNINEYSLAIKSCLIAADRFCSSCVNDIRLIKAMNDGELTDENLDNIFNDKWNLSNPINMVAPECFDASRFNTQKEYALEAANADSNVTIIKAPAGFGKTITGLLWLSNMNKKTLWVCPINTIATSTYESIIDELKTFNLDVKVELLIANEIKASNFTDGSADITVTNIDNFLRPTINNEKAERNYDLINYSVIFDEFHELDSDSAIFAGFVNIVGTRMHLCPNSKTLLLSATPEKLNMLWDTNTIHKTHIIKAQPLNNMEGKYRIIFKDALEAPSNTKDALYMFNSVLYAQHFYLSNQDSFSNIIHSSFIDSDKERIRLEIKGYHGKQMKDDIETRSKYNVVGTRIIGTGLDISFGELHENVSSPELTIQSIGRINRYSEITDKPVNLYLYRLADNKNENGAIGINYSTKLTEMWYNFLTTTFKNGQEITLIELYEAYDKFYEDADFLAEYYKLMKAKLDKSKQNYAKLTPKKFFNVPKTKKETITIQKNSLRSSNSDSKFVICQYSDSVNFIDSPMQLEERAFKEIEENLDCDKVRTEYIKILQESTNWYQFDVKRAMGAKTNKIGFTKLLEMSINSGNPFILMGYKYHKNVGLMKF